MAVFLNDVSVTDVRAAEIMENMLLTIFPEADPSNKSIVQMYYGGHKHMFSYTSIMMFLCLTGFSFILSAVFFLTTNTRPYQSCLNTVTPDIQTPAAVGQYQHGSAKWLTDKEKDKAFESFVLDPDDGQIAELLRSGCDGLDFMKD
jgi:hypothetical protein